MHYPFVDRRSFQKRFARTLLIVGLAILVVGVTTACGSTASAPAAPAQQADATEGTVQSPADPTAIPANVEQTAVSGAADSQVTEAGEPEAQTPAAAQQAAAKALQTFQIVPDGTEARFYIDEVLMGQDKTVVGVTSLVTGDILLDPADPTASEVGEIRIDARDLQTDDDRRTRQLRNNILKSSQDPYQFIVFRPTSIEGMPASVTIGEPFTFSLTGDLTILDVTRPVTFAMTVTPSSEHEIQGSGSTAVQYADFGISIPSVPFVAAVGDEVTLEIVFKAATEA